jgi:YD repeat-containing protein
MLHGSSCGDDLDTASITRRVLRTMWLQPHTEHVGTLSRVWRTRGRRSYVIRTGGAFAQGHQDAWGYNDRDELTGSLRYDNTTPGSTQDPVAALDRVYAYDPIGNRTLSRDGTDPNTVYTANNLNQYDPVTKQTSPKQTAQRLEYDADGNLVEMYLAGDINDDGYVNQTDLGILNAAMNTCEGDPNYDEAANLRPACRPPATPTRASTRPTWACC